MIWTMSRPDGEIENANARVLRNGMIACDHETSDPGATPPARDRTNAIQAFSVLVSRLDFRGGVVGNSTDASCNKIAAIATRKLIAAAKIVEPRIPR